MGWQGNSKWQRSPKWLNLSILNPLSPWERARERAVSASLLWANANLAGSLSNHRIFAMPEDDFVCAGMRQFLSVPAKGRLKPV